MLDSCAYVNELERTRQGPFSIQDCLKQDQYTVSEIQEKIQKMHHKLDHYLDIQMNKYRLLKTKNPNKFTLKRKNEGGRKSQQMYERHDQWNFVE